MRIFRYFMLIACIIGLSYCAPKTPEDFNNEKELYEYGLKLFEDKSYSEAATFFETLKNKYPTSPYITEAEFKLAESYYNKRDYIEAIYAYQNFRTLHPTNKYVPEAVYKIALSYYKQMPGSIDRDQTSTVNCINTLDELLARYPGFEEAAKASELRSKCKRMLAERELYIANFYLKQKSYNAALGRLETIKNGYDFRDLKQEAIYKLALSYHKLKNRDKTVESLNELLMMQPDPSYKEKADSLLAKIESEGVK